METINNIYIEIELFRRMEDRIVILENRATPNPNRINFWII